MKKLLLMVIGCLISGNVMYSQDASLEEKATTMTKEIQSQIGFREEIYTKVYDVNLEFVTKTQDLKQSDGSKIKKFKTLKSLDKDRDKALKAVFTDEEYKSFEKHKSENRQAFKDRMQEARG